MLSVGVDAIEIGRIARVYEKFGDRFLYKVYTEREAARYRGRVNELAARFAAKEAVSKVLGTGLHGISWREVEVLPNPRGKPLVYLYGRARQRAIDLGLSEIAISLTHSQEMAMAFAVAT